MHGVLSLHAAHVANHKPWAVWPLLPCVRLAERWADSAAAACAQIEVIRANVVGTLTLADVTNERGIHLTIYATGCIFHYDKDFPQDSGIGFKEDDTPNFTGSYYSKTKVRVARPASVMLGLSS